MRKHSATLARECGEHFELAFLTLFLVWGVCAIISVGV